MSIYEFGTMPRDELVSLFENELFIKENGAYLGDVACAISNFGSDGVKILLDFLESGSDLQRINALFGLSNSAMDREGKRKLFLSFLSDKNPLVISEAIDALAEVKNIDDWNNVKLLKHSPSEFVRGAILRFARQVLNKRRAYEILLEGLNDSNYIVIENAIDELEALGDIKALVHIEKFTNHPNQDVRQAAITAQKNLKDLRTGSSGTSLEL